MLHNLPKNVDIVCDLSYGDCGKGKVSAYLSKVNNYNVVARWAGGDNAGHTVFVDGNKYKTNLIPSGIFHSKTSVVGRGCVLNVDSFLSEVKYLEDNGFDISKIKVDGNCHIVLPEHIDFDKSNLSKKLGTTSRGIAPAYAAKAARNGVLAKDVLPQNFIWNNSCDGDMLCEGAQGFYLDVDHGNYPYVTSSTTLPYGACSIGFPPSRIRNIYGVTKIYDTRSGEDPSFPDTLFNDEELLKLGDLGEEYGVVTGRRRKVNWLNLDKLLYAANVSGANIVIINKCDIIQSLGIYKLIHNQAVKSFESLAMMISYVKNHINEKCSVPEVIFSFNPETL